MLSSLGRKNQQNRTGPVRPWFRWSKLTSASVLFDRNSLTKTGSRRCTYRTTQFRSTGAKRLQIYSAHTRNFWLCPSVCRLRVQGISGPDKFRRFSPNHLILLLLLFSWANSDFDLFLKAEKIPGKKSRDFRNFCSLKTRYDVLGMVI